MTNIQLKQFKVRPRQPSVWEGIPGQKTTSTTLLGTMSWFLVAASLLSMFVSSLLIANGGCSQPRGLSATSPVCVGGQLSVQAWLAIVGVEFTLLGLVVAPRIHAVLVSKILTWRLTHGGMPLAKLLNSQANAPSWTKFRMGSRLVLCLRLLSFCAAITFSILYKFSFVRVGRVDTIAITDANKAIAMGCNPNSNCDGISTNFLHALSASNSSSSFNTTINPTINSAPKSYLQVFGPGQNNIAHQLSEGELYLCTPTYYSRTTITPNASYWKPPALTPDSNLKGLRFTNPTSASILDISSPNGVLTLFTGTFGLEDQEARYDTMLTATTRLCLGWASWSVNNTIAPTSYLQDPRDIVCVDEMFNLTSWIEEPSSQLPLGVLQGLGWNPNMTLAISALNIILATHNHTSSQNRLNATYKSIPAFDALEFASDHCTLAHATSGQWVINGTFPNAGTGQTLLGAVLQGLVLLLSLLTLLLLFTPVLPLVSEWPAQWLGLVYGLSPSKVQEVVEGTSAGRNAAGAQGRVDKDVKVFMSSGGGDVIEGAPYLILSAEKGRVRWGRRHV